MPITPTMAQLGGSAPGLGDMLNQQQETETEEQKKRRRQQQAAGSPTEQAFLGAAAQFGIGGLR